MHGIGAAMAWIGGTWLFFEYISPNMNLFFDIFVGIIWTITWGIFGIVIACSGSDTIINNVTKVIKRDPSS